MGKQAAPLARELVGNFGTIKVEKRTRLRDGLVSFTATHSGGVMYFDTEDEAVDWAKSNAATIKRFEDVAKLEADSYAKFRNRLASELESNWGRMIF